MNTQLLYKYGFYFLLLLNIGLLTFVFLRPKKGPPPPAHFKHQVAKTLDLTAAQNTAYQTLVETHSAKMVENNTTQKELIASYFHDLTGQETAIEEEVILIQIGEIEQQKITDTYNHFKALEQLLQEEQLNAFPALVSDALHVLLAQNGKKKQKE